MQCIAARDGKKLHERNVQQYCSPRGMALATQRAMPFGLASGRQDIWNKRNALPPLITVFIQLEDL